jgi:tripartite-type tricarboxylate transporter receptor subunit TctC
MLLALALVLVAGVDAGAQPLYPAKSVRLVLGFPAGTNVDVLARPIAQRMSETFGHPVVVDNRPGATGLIANEFVAKAPPDGYTLLVAPGSSLTSAPHLKLKMPYDALKDFAPIIQINSFPQVLIVNPTVPAKTVKEVIGIARSGPACSRSVPPAPAARSIWRASSSRAWRKSTCCMCLTKAATWR